MGHPGKAAARNCIVPLGDLNAYLGSDGTRRAVIVRKVLLYRNPSGVLLLDFCFSHELVIRDTIFLLGVVYECTLYQSL